MLPVNKTIIDMRYFLEKKQYKKKIMQEQNL